MRAYSLWIVLGLLGSGAAAGVAAGRMEDTKPSASPPEGQETRLPVTATLLGRLSPDAARLYAAVRDRRPGELAWQQIPWRVDLDEGIRMAREEKRPLLLFVSGDDPLEKC